MLVHRQGLKHLAISIFILADGKILLQRRALSKYHTPGLWTNTCCTHPFWDENTSVSALRRLDEELGMKDIILTKRKTIEYRSEVPPDLIEHEIVDIFVGKCKSNHPIKINPNEVLVELEPRKGEHTIRTEDVVATIKEVGDELALVMIGGVNYYTGQVFDMKTITKAGQEQGAYVGWDLAHGAGNIPLELHEWNVDFACWCSYKYLNSGPGSISGVFVNERHCNNPDLPRFAGWWGHDKETRFLMEKGFNPIRSAESWQLSNAPVLAMAVHKVAIDLHSKIGMKALRKKSLKLTSYLEFCIQQVSDRHPNATFEIITPSNPNERGAQLSILVHGKGKQLFDYLTKNGVIADWREPNVIRIASVPIYNSFEDCYRFSEVLNSAVES